MNAEQVRTQAREANSGAKWDAIWKAEGDETWRATAMSSVYARIVSLLPKDKEFAFADCGGGIGVLAREICKAHPLSLGHVLDQSQEAIQHINAATDSRLSGKVWDFEADRCTALSEHDYTIATEFLEHLSAEARDSVVAEATGCIGGAFFSVPNNRLGPDEEAQHTIKFTALEFKRYLHKHFEDVRVECIGGYLLGVCGAPAKKGFTLSLTLPVRNEAEDLERVLASFRGAADEMVVGIDPRTTDNTREVAARYAEVVFELESPRGPPGDEVAAADGVHFSWLRNQCMARCTSDWIFMTEGHESLMAGTDTLLRLDKIVPEHAGIGLVARTGAGQQWAFPWLSRRDSRVKYERATHNQLEWPKSMYVVTLPQVRTDHFRNHNRAVSRAVQRTAQNKLWLMSDWLERASEQSLFYLSQEFRVDEPERARARMIQFIATSNNGPNRYQARLVLSRELALAGLAKEARAMLCACTGDDWSRTEHFLWLGDMALEAGQLEEAYQFYRLSATRIGNPPFTPWWIDLSHYTYLPAQRLASVAAQLGFVNEASVWARKAVELLPSDAPAEVRDEALTNVRLLKEFEDNDATSSDRACS